MKFFNILALSAASALALAAAPAVAETAGTTTTPTTSGTGWGGFDSGDTLVINVIGGAGHQGTFGAVFDAGPNGTGEAGVEKEGYSTVDIKLDYNSCGGTDCTTNKVTGTLGAGETGTSWAQAYGTASGVPVTAQNIGVASAALQFGIGINTCPTGCPTGTGTTSGQ
jgi:hypothetical protein